MATFAFLNAKVVFNSVDLSDHVRACTLNLQGAALDSATMGDSWNENTMGLKSGTVQLEFLDDFAASQVDATLWGAFNTGTAVAVTVKPVNAATSATNPEYQFNVLPNAHMAGGKLGEMAAVSVTLPITGAVTRATS
jgi:hypothetical protein